MYQNLHGARGFTSQVSISRINLDLKHLICMFLLKLHQRFKRYRRYSRDWIKDRNEESVLLFHSSWVQTLVLLLTARFRVPACPFWSLSVTEEAASPGLKIKPFWVPLLQLLHIKVETKHQTTADFLAFNSVRYNSADDSFISFCYQSNNTGVIMHLITQQRTQPSKTHSSDCWLGKNVLLFQLNCETAQW